MKQTEIPKNFYIERCCLQYFCVHSVDKGWVVDPDAQLAGVTQTCITKVEERVSLPINFILLADARKAISSLLLRRLN